MEASSDEELETRDESRVHSLRPRPPSFERISWQKKKTQNAASSNRVDSEAAGPPARPKRRLTAYSTAAKIARRETYGSFSGRHFQPHRKVFEKIPPRLRFSLMDIVPSHFLHDHIFMGFTQCGQFLLSFTYHVNNATTNQTEFREGFNFRLHFLSWAPGQLAKLVHSVPIFDDDCVDNRVAVSIAQWKHNSSILVVYGIAEISTEHSYLSVVGVPRLGCRKCSTLVNSNEVLDCGGKRCIQHNFAIHTKFYCAAESAICEPVVQLAYHNQIIIYTDFIHILEIDLIKTDQILDENGLEDKSANEICSTPTTLCNIKSPQPPDQNNPSTSTVIQSILADFSDMEVEPHINVKPIQVPDMVSHEVCIQALRAPQPSPGCSEVYVGIEDGWDSVPSPRNLISPPLRSPSRRPAESLLRFNEMHRIADKTYEFVEETESKCEKLSIFRKRRLADKKYEFSEDNSENIVPFRVLRSNRKYYIGTSNRNSLRRPKSPPCEGVILRVHNQINPSPIHNSDMKYGPVITQMPIRETIHDIEYRVTAMQEDGSLKTVAIHDNSSKTLSDYVVHPHDPYLVHSGNSKCSKHFKRRFVESDDDITSIITDSEDDCISGYHVALPLVAHGAGYAPLQPVSMGAWERMRVGTPVLQASQRSLDIELLCNEVCVRLCRLNKKKFIYCFDWGCHVINVCQSSGCICGVCAMWLWATEEETDDNGESSSLCHSCKDSNSWCIIHRKQYAAECLFVWDLVSGLYKTEHVSFKEDPTQDSNRESGSDRARQMAVKLAPIPSSHGQDVRLLTTLTGRSLKRLTDLDHCIEITKQHPDISETETSATEESDSD